MIGTCACPGFVRKPTTCLHGILDEMNNNERVEGSSNDLGSDPKYEKLFEDIVFCTDDFQRSITTRLDDCANPGFLQWLEVSQTKCEDAEEFEAMKDLRMMINDAVKAKEDADTTQKLLESQKEAEKKRLEEEILEESSLSGANMSAADILRKANEIDEAIVSAVASEDDQPDDFMRDAKAYCGLGGFNNRGHMRVGGN